MSEENSTPNVNEASNNNNQIDLSNDSMLNEIWTEDGQLRGHEQDLDVNSWLKEVAENPEDSPSKSSNEIVDEGVEELEPLQVTNVNDSNEELEDNVESDEINEISEENEAPDELGDDSGFVSEVKTISFKDGEQEFQVPENATIEVMVDGELLEVPLSEIKNGISGQKAISRRFSELDVQRRELEKRQSVINDTISEVSALVQEGRGLEAAGVMFDRAGINTEQVLVQMFEQLAPHLEQYVQLSPQQQQIYKERLEAQADKIKLEKLQQESQALKLEQQTKYEIDNLQSELQLSNEQFVKLYDNLIREMDQGLLNKVPVTPKLLKDYHNLVVKEGKAMEALKRVNPALAQNHHRVAEIVSEANRLMREQGISLNRVDFNKIVSKIYGNVQESKAKHTKPMPPKEVPKKGPQKGKPNEYQQRADRIGKMLNDIATADDSTIDQLVNKHSQLNKNKPRHY